MNNMKRYVIAWAVNKDDPKQTVDIWADNRDNAILAIADLVRAYHDTRGFLKVSELGDTHELLNEAE